MAFEFIAQVQLNFLKEQKSLKVLRSHKHVKSGRLGAGETHARAPTGGKARCLSCLVCHRRDGSLAQPHMKAMSGRETCCARKCTGIYVGMRWSLGGGEKLLLY